MRIIFMGTPDFAVPALTALYEAGHEIACVYTQPPSRSGRGKRLSPSPVHKQAEALGIEVRTPKSLKGAAEQEAFASLGADVAVVAAYGLILPAPVLDAPSHGCINIHASILPRWRGAAPIHRAVMAGDQETGITIMQMEAGLDSGPTRHIVTTTIGAKTTGDLFEELAEMGGAAVVEVLGDLAAYPPRAQDYARATHAPKIDKAEARIDWSRPARELVRHVAGLAPFPGAWFELGGERIKLLLAQEVEGHGEPGKVIDADLTVACGQGALRPVRLQRAGKPAMDRADFLRGLPVAAGESVD